MKNHASSPSLIPPEAPYPELTDLAPDILGRGAVQDAAVAAYHEATADRLQNVQETAAGLKEAKVHPATQGRLRRGAARLSGKLMTTREAELVDYAASYELISPDTAREHAANLRGYVHDQLDSVRHTLQGLDLGSLVAGELAFSLYCKQAPEALQDSKREKAPDSSWREWLASRAEDEDLLGFLQWHVNLMEERSNDPERQQEYESSRQGYKEAVSESVTAGWLHEDAQAAIQKTDDIKIYWGDIFDTFLKARGGYHTTGSKYVVMSGSDQIDVAHELNHAVLGDFSSRWRREAITEHTARSLINGQPNIIDPFKRSDSERDIYVEERALYADFLRDVPVRLATRAYSETASKSAKQELEAALNKAWSHVLPKGKSATELLDAHVAGLEEEISTANKKLPAGIVTGRALERARKGLHERPEVVFGAETATQNSKAGTSPKEAEVVAALRSSEEAFVQLIGMLLPDQKGFLKKPSPEAPNSLLTSITEVDTELEGLRSQGISEKKAFRTLVKRYHTDGDQGDSEKIRAVNQRLEEFNRRGGAQNANK